jgi:biofilm PGA synthesis N-glycosyltransferase PgaC
MKNLLPVSICIPAYNEEKNIERILHALLSQKTKRVEIKKIVVICSGCTDNTAVIAEGFQKNHPQVVVLCEAERNGKASAINTFLQIADEPVVVIESADTIPYEDCIEKLCAPFINNKKLGMTGGAPIPVNDPNTFLGYIIHSWWWFHRNIPRFGEIIAYRNVLPRISSKTAVDEAFIQAKLVKMGYDIVHVDEAKVSNKGPETVRDLIKQRRRIFNGHTRLWEQQQVKIDNMTRSSLKILLFEYKINSLKELVWFTGGIMIEIYARMLGKYDSKVKKINPFVWDTATTTKNLAVSEVKSQ